MRKYTKEDYPLINHKEEIFTPGGNNIEEITFENVIAGNITAEDCRTSKDSLIAQADIAESAGNNHMADNFRRAAEMVDIDSETILSIYNALRPYRSTEEDLVAIVEKLNREYHAPKTAEFVDSAMKILKIRSKLKGDR